ncbi:MAG: polysaccharide biosynthesis C-terminal domain-containing protein [Clostridia bacterium]|nr:polysaccharide biosynthesis C-terminal domain-containing protein [Clostridia bacterium]
MRSTKAFIKDGIMLTVTALILRSAGVFFSARLSLTAGNAVMGLYTQIMTVYAFAVTAASAGINLGAMRIISECCGSGNTDKLSSAMRSCVSYCLKAGILVGAIMFLSAPFLGGVVLGDSRTVVSLRALSVALPFIALSNAFHGYFNGIKHISKSAFTSLFEQFVRIISTIIALNVFISADTETLCLILVICNAASEALSFLLLSVFYLVSKKGLPTQKRSTAFLRKRFLGITVPIAISSLIRSALTTTEHILIPIGLRASGLDYEGSLAEYGIVSGMVMPILLYPMALLTSFASVTIAELSARASAGENVDSIRKTVTKGLSFALIYGIGCSAIIGCFSTQLGYAIYKSAEAGKFIKILSPLIFFMYLDHISDGMLKGLDKQNYVMKVNILDAALSVLFAIILIPRFGIYGFIASLYLCECLNCFFSFGRIFLLICPKLKIFVSFIMPTACAFVAVHLVNTLAVCGAPLLPIILLALAVYVVLLKITGALNVFTSQPPLTESTYAV